MLPQLGTGRMRKGNGPGRCTRRMRTGTGPGLRLLPKHRGASSKFAVSMNLHSNFLPSIIQPSTHLPRRHLVLGILRQTGQHSPSQKARSGVLLSECNSGAQIPSDYLLKGELALSFPETVTLPPKTAKTKKAITFL